MRVIAGIKRGLKLFDFEGSSIRPTTDRVKENIFNIIMPYVYGAKVLDLFCGTGALSVEALSRGAEEAVLCDISSDSINLAKKNVRHAAFSDKCVFHHKSGIDFLNTCPVKFDIIFLDPPYNSSLAEKSLKLIFEKDILSDGGIVVLERDETDTFEFSGAHLIKEKKYGRTYISLYSAG